MEVLPCSRIAHIERAHKPYTEDLTAHVRRNALRVAEVWMDEFKSHVYMAWNIPQEVGCPCGDGFLGVLWGKKQTTTKRKDGTKSSFPWVNESLIYCARVDFQPQNILHVEDRRLTQRCLAMARPHPIPGHHEDFFFPDLSVLL